MKPTDRTSELAECIASEILTMIGHPRAGERTECTRAALMLEQHDGTEINLGGRGKPAIISVIKSELLRARVWFGDSEARSPLEKRIDHALAKLRAELLRAMKKHAPMATAHHGYAVILEELDELWDHVKADTGQTDKAREEAMQIAAMGLRYALDVAPEWWPCAACDRGDHQLGHHHLCPKNEQPEQPA